MKGRKHFIFYCAFLLYLAIKTDEAHDVTAWNLFEFLFIFPRHAEGTAIKADVKLKVELPHRLHFRLKSIKECLFIHRFSDKIFNSTKTEKRLINMVACKRNVLSLPLLFTCLWLEMFSCTWWNTGNISANYKPLSDTRRWFKRCWLIDVFFSY